MRCDKRGSPQEQLMTLGTATLWCERRIFFLDFEVFFLGTAIARLLQTVKVFLPFGPKDRVDPFYQVPPTCNRRNTSRRGSRAS